MIAKFVLWVISFAFSFPLSEIGMIEQGKIFLCMHIIASSVFFVVETFIHILKNDFSRPLVFDFVFILEIALTLIASWGVSKIFTIDFYVAYEIITLGKCICFNIRNKD